MDETPQQRQDRVTAMVKERFPTVLTPNRLLNAILDIIRGERFAREDVTEAIDALVLLHLKPSLTWKPEPVVIPTLGVAIWFGTNPQGQEIFDGKGPRPAGVHYVNDGGNFVIVDMNTLMDLTVRARKLARTTAKRFVAAFPGEVVTPERMRWLEDMWRRAPRELHGFFNQQGEDPIWHAYRDMLQDEVRGYLPPGTDPKPPTV